MGTAFTPAMADAAAFPTLTAHELVTIADDMNSRGFGVAVGCIRPEILSSLCTLVETKVDEAGGEYVGLTGRNDIRDTFLERIAADPQFVSACRTIFTHGTGRPAPDVPFHQVLRCLAGETGRRHAYIFHYDSFVLTALMPVVIPSDGQSGDLIMFPNVRTIRRYYLRNVLDKVVLDNRMTQRLLRRLVLSGSVVPTRIRMVPGNIYFFWGCRSIHANEPCDADKIRATALFHYVDPHADSWLRSTLRGKTMMPTH